MRSLWPPASVAHPFPRGSVGVGSPEEMGETVAEKMGRYKKVLQLLKTSSVHSLVPSSDRTYLWGSVLVCWRLLGNAWGPWGAPKCVLFPRTAKE